MTREETLRIIEILHANQNHFRDDGHTIQLWHRHFQEERFDDVLKAVDRFIDNNVENYPVSVAKIKAWLPNRKTSYNVTNRAYNLKEKDGKYVIDKIVYRVCTVAGHEVDSVIDSDGYVYSCPDPENNRKLLDRVRDTGMILSEEAADKEYAALAERIARIEPKRGDEVE